MRWVTAKVLKWQALTQYSISKTEMMPQNEKWEGLGKLRRDGSHTSVLLVFEGMPGCFIGKIYKLFLNRKKGGGGAHVVLELLPFIATTCRSAHKQGGSKGTGFYPGLCSINPWHPDIIMHILHSVLSTLPRF